MGGFFGMEMEMRWRRRGEEGGGEEGDFWELDELF